MADCPVIVRSTNPEELVLAKTRAWSMMPVIVKLLLPGTKVMSYMVLLPTRPLAVDRLSVTLPFLD